jgi:hypothetical protein
VAGFFISGDYMATIEHVNIPDGQRHEPAHAGTAAAATFNVANGDGTTQYRLLQAADIANAGAIINPINSDFDPITTNTYNLGNINLQWGTLFSYNINLNPNTVSPTSNGQIIANATQQAIQTQQGGLLGFIPTVIYSSYITAATSGTSASSWIPTSGVGLTIIPANWFVPGKKLRIRAYGVVTTAAAPGTSTIALALGTNIIWSPSAFTPTASLTNVPFELISEIVCSSAGASGTAIMNSTLKYTTAAATAPVTLTYGNNSAVTLNTTVNNSLVLSSTNSVSSGTVYTVESLTMESLA